MYLFLQEVGGVCSRTFECPTGDSGSNPVCGSDRRTYSSRCTLQLAKCNGHRVRMAYKGSCKGENDLVLNTLPYLFAEFGS